MNAIPMRVIMQEGEPFVSVQDVIDYMMAVDLALSSKMERFNEEGRWVGKGAIACLDTIRERMAPLLELTREAPKDTKPEGSRFLWLLRRGT